MSINGDLALDACKGLAFDSVLDIGSGAGLHSNYFRDLGKKVTTIDIAGDSDIVGDYVSTNCGKFDLVWCCHVLEHQLNVNSFLTKCYSEINDGGYIAVTVPPLKHEIVGGHVTLWNPGLLLYNLILAGFDCSEAMVASYGYNISVIVKKKPFEMPELNYDFGDIEKLRAFFPVSVTNGFDGRLQERLNWPK